MTQYLLIDAVHPEETRVVLTDHKSHIHEFDFTTAAKQQLKGNVYLAKVTRVEPSLQAAFVEYGGGKQGFLPFSEIHPDYYQIPVSDRQRLIEEDEREAARAERDDERNEGAELDDDLDEDEGETESDAENETGSLAAAAEEAESVSSEAIDEDAEAKDADADDGDDEKSRQNRGKFRRRRRRGKRSHIRSVTDDNTEIETISGEEEIERPQRRGAAYRRYKIQEVIKRNQVLLVQVIKEERGNKGVSLTSYLSLAGRYCVLMPNSPRAGGVSRKIGSGDDRKKLKKIIDSLDLPKGMSVIIRTAGAKRTKAEIKRDFDYLVKLWNQIREDTLSSSAPALIYEESNLIKRTIRDIYNNDIENIYVEGEGAYKEAKNFMKMMIPSHAPKVKLHKSNVPLFHEHDVEEQLLSMYDPVARLKSGGYLVINSTEALIAIDVNSGRSTSERNVEETALKTNIEAAKEVARQLKLRDLAGLIVIDFIDMMEGKNRRAVENAFKDALKSDRAKLQVGRISSFGLLELSRQRLRPSINESINQPCPACNATGYVRSDNATALQVIRAIEKDAGSGNIRQVNIHVTQPLLIFLANELRHEIDALEDKFELTVRLMVDDSLKPGHFRIERVKERKQERHRSQSSDSEETSSSSSSSSSNSTHSDDDRKERRSRRRGGRGRGRRNRDDDRDTDHKAREEKSSPAGSTAEKSSHDYQKPEKESRSDDAEPQADAEKSKPSGRTRRSTSRRQKNDKDDDSKTSVAVKESPQSENAQKDERKSPAKSNKESASTKDSQDSSPANDDSPESGPKRKGWWQKIIE